MRKRKDKIRKKVFRFVFGFFFFFRYEDFIFKYLKGVENEKKDGEEKGLRLDGKLRLLRCIRMIFLIYDLSFSRNWMLSSSEDEVSFKVY